VLDSEADDTDLAAGTLQANDVETINLSSLDSDPILDSDGDEVKIETNSITLAADAAESVVVDGNAHLTLTLDSSSDQVTSVDASAMTGALKLEEDSTNNGADAGTTITGGAGDDTLKAFGSNDVLNGGAGDDVLAGGNLTQLTGGAGADTFEMNTPSNVNSYSTITDLETGDVIDLDVGNNGDVVFSSSAVQLASTAVFQDYANEAVNLLGSDTDDAAWFQFDGDTYIVQSGDTTPDNDFVNGSDSIIQISGLVDLSAASYNQDEGALEIA